MEILLKEQIENYRFSIAKVLFLSIEYEYRLYEDIPESNLMLVKDYSSNVIKCISILGRPTKKIDKYPILVYYRKADYAKYKDKTKSMKMIQNVFLLSEEFDEYFSKAVELAFTNPKEFLKMYSPYGRDIIIEEMINYYFKQAENRLINDIKVFYKYYSFDTVENNRYEVKDGAISFSSPKFFNDPFDCNCVLANNEDMSDKFRALCLIQDYKNILMWSYYAQNHEGYCFGFNTDSIINEIKKLGNTGLCMYGSIDYKKTRPPQKARVKEFSFTDLKFYIDVVFTKYEKWSHECEVRFVIVSSDIKEDFIKIKPEIEKVYQGCKAKLKENISSRQGEIRVTKLYKSAEEYLIENREEYEYKQ